MSEKKNIKENGTQKMTKKQNLFQAVKFALFSASAGIIQIVSFTLLVEIIKTDEWVANLISLILSVLWNFTFNRKFTFQSAANIPIAMLKVAAFYCVFTPLSTWFTNYGNDVLELNTYLVQAICMVTNLITEYLYCRFVVYRNSMNTNDLAKKEKEKEAAKADSDK